MTIDETEELGYACQIAKHQLQTIDMTKVNLTGRFCLDYVQVFFRNRMILPFLQSYDNYDIL